MSKLLQDAACSRSWLLTNVPFGELTFLHFAFTLHSDRLIMDATVHHCTPYSSLIFISAVFHSYVSILSTNFPV